jgi:hypothetical protein
MDESCDLCFEYSSLYASIASHVTSVKNPADGHICAQAIGNIIIDEHAPSATDCKIVQLADAHQADNSSNALCI